ncbi:MAG: GNAT family N-acetyltransferase [Pseudomonadota bacterium]
MPLLAAAPMTQRLRFDRFRESDADDLAAILADPEVTRHITANGSSSERCAATAQNRIAWHNSTWDEKGYGVWALRVRDETVAAPDRVIGWCGFVPPDIDAQEPEILYGLARDVWGVGLGQEAARAAIDWLFETTSLAGASAIISTKLNPASVNVVTKLGMTVRGTLAYTNFLSPGPLARDVLDYELWRLGDGPADDNDTLIFQTCFRIGQLMAVNDVDPDAMEADLAAKAALRSDGDTQGGDAARAAFRAGLETPWMDWFYLDRERLVPAI